MARPLPQTSALTAEQFAAAMCGYGLTENAKIAVAVSGGADSMALALLLAEWAAERAIHLTALTIDHRLRAEAAAEAAQVAAWLGARGIAHETLAWGQGIHLRGLARSPQKAARDARYALLASWCVQHGASHLFLAHHADDQVETFLMRLARGSGVNGLAAMAPAAALHGVVLARPLLDVPKQTLLACCAERGQAWIEDPSNRNPMSTRVRFRAARSLLETEGLTRDRLLATVKHMQRARVALEDSVAALLADACVWDEFGVARFSLAALQAVPAEIALRALARILIAAAGTAYGPRFETLQRLYARLRSGPWRDSTLHGCVLQREGEALMVSREPSQIGSDAMLSSGSHAIWDGRFRLRLASNKHVIEYRIAAANAKDVPAPVREGQGWASIPAAVRQTLPVLHDSEGLAAVPHAKFYRNDVIYLSDALEVTSIAPLNMRHSGDAEL